MRELKIIQSKSYLNMMAARTNREEHQEQLDNAYNQIEYLEDWRRKAIKIIKEGQELNRNIEFKLSKERSKGITNSNRVDILEKENKSLQEEVKVLIDQLMEELNID